MKLTPGQVLDIMRQIRNQMSHGRLGWHQEGSGLRVNLPNQFTIFLCRLPDSRFEATIKRGEEEVLGVLQLPDAGSEGKELSEMYQAAEGEAVAAVYSEIIDSIKMSGSASISVSAEVVRKVPPPQGVPAEKAAAVLKLMAGRWHLDFSRGKETAIIRGDGLYYIEGRSEPSFRLVVLAVNDAAGTVEVAKDKLDGRRLQIEFLKISPESMVGHAKHDMHKLNYTKAPEQKR